MHPILIQTMSLPLRAQAHRLMLARRLKDLPLLLIAGLLLLPVLAVLGSWLSWNAASGQILSATARHRTRLVRA